MGGEAVAGPLSLTAPQGEEGDHNQEKEQEKQEEGEGGATADLPS